MRKGSFESCTFLAGFSMKLRRGYARLQDPKHVTGTCMQLVICTVTKLNSCLQVAGSHRSSPRGRALLRQGTAPGALEGLCLGRCRCRRLP